MIDASQRAQPLPATSLQQRGFTLVELVVTIVIIGILSSIGGMFISQPIQGYIDLERRTELVDQAEMALRRMQRDIRAALPNSVREIEVDGKVVGLELLHVVDGGRYRGAADPHAADSVEAQKAVLDFSAADSYFEVLGGLSSDKDYTLENCLCVIYNLSADQDVDIANAYAQNYSKKNTAVIQSESSDHKFLTLASAKKFPFSSPYQRFFIVDVAVTYKVVGTELRRYSDYTINNTVGPSSGDPYALVAKNLHQDSLFAYRADTENRSGMVTMQLVLEKDEERITLLHQVHVDNAP